MAINFPNSPQVNDTYTEGNRSWTWNGVYWRATSVTVGYTGSKGDQGDGLRLLGSVATVNDLPSDGTSDGSTLLDGVTAPIGNGVPNSQQISDYQIKPIPKPDGEEVMVFQTVTTSFSGKYNQFVNLPLGAELIKEYWI